LLAGRLGSRRSCRVTLRFRGKHAREPGIGGQRCTNHIQRAARLCALDWLFDSTDGFTSVRIPMKRERSNGSLMLANRYNGYPGSLYRVILTIYIVNWMLVHIYLDSIFPSPPFRSHINELGRCTDCLPFVPFLICKSPGPACE
jgi:hypothetical protein